MTELARQAVKTLPGGNHIRELNLEYESGSAVARTRAFALRQTPTLPPTHTRAFAWSEEADTFKKTEYWDRPSVLVTVETLRSVCADLY